MYVTFIILSLLDSIKDAPAPHWITIIAAFCGVPFAGGMLFLGYKAYKRDSRWKAQTETVSKKDKDLAKIEYFKSEMRKHLYTRDRLLSVKTADGFDGREFLRELDEDWKNTEKMRNFVDDFEV